jgi:hypothetical protein
MQLIHLDLQANWQEILILLPAYLEMVIACIAY